MANTLDTGNKGESSRPFNSDKTPAIVAAEAGSGGDALTLYFGDPEQQVSSVEIGSTAHDAAMAYQVPTPPQSFPNSFVTEPYTPKDWKQGKPGA